MLSSAKRGPVRVAGVAPRTPPAAVDARPPDALAKPSDPLKLQIAWGGGVNARFFGIRARGFRGETPRSIIINVTVVELSWTGGRTSVPVTGLISYC